MIAKLILGNYSRIILSEESYKSTYVPTCLVSSSFSCLILKKDSYIKLYSCSKSGSLSAFLRIEEKELCLSQFSGVQDCSPSLLLRIHNQATCCLCAENDLLFAVIGLKFWLCSLWLSELPLPSVVSIYFSEVCCLMVAFREMNSSQQQQTRERRGSLVWDRGLWLLVHTLPCLSR